MTVCSLEWVYINQNFVFWAHTARWEPGTEGTFPPAREHRFTIYPYDPVTGVYFAHARLYDADLGRMLSKDPVKRGLNGYLYCGNDPVNHTDPTGEIPTVLLFGAGGGILGGIAGFAGSALDQLSSGDEFSLRRALGSAANGMVTGAVKGALIGSGAGIPVAFGADFAAGAAGSLLEQAISGERMNAGRGICALQDIFGGGLGIRKAYGYRYEMRDPDQPVRDGFDLGDFFRSTLIGGLMGGLSGVAFYGMDKAVGALKGSLSGRGINENRADFYVTPNGDAVPSMEYRYMPRNADHMPSLRNTMEIPANIKGTYITFDKFDIPAPEKLQVPHDASIRGSFTTLQIIDDIRIPNGEWGKASWLEPITKDNPIYGPGGATQAVTNQKIILDSLKDLLK